MQAAPPGPRDAAREGIGLAVPSRPILSLAQATAAAMASVTGRDRTLGPHWVRGTPGPQGRERSATVPTGQRGTADHRPSNLSSRNDASWRFRLWSRRSGVRASSISLPSRISHPGCPVRWRSFHSRFRVPGDIPLVRPSQADYFGRPSAAVETPVQRGCADFTRHT
jgi:hypothetical protein